jgi:hypothetical protein
MLSLATLFIGFIGDWYRMVNAPFTDRLCKYCSTKWLCCCAIAMPFQLLVACNFSLNDLEVERQLKRNFIKLNEKLINQKYFSEANSTTAVNRKMLKRMKMYLLESGV